MFISKESMDFELFRENRIFWDTISSLYSLQQTWFKRQKERRRSSNADLQKCYCYTVKLFCETGIFIVNLRSFFPLVPDSCLHRGKWRFQGLGLILNLRVCIVWYLLWITREEIQRKKWIRQSKKFWLSYVQNLKLGVTVYGGTYLHPECLTKSLKPSKFSKLWSFQIPKFFQNLEIKNCNTGSISHPAETLSRCVQWLQKKLVNTTLER